MAKSKTLFLVATAFCLQRPRAVYALCSNQKLISEWVSEWGTFISVSCQLLLAKLVYKHFQGSLFPFSWGMHSWPSEQWACRRQTTKVHVVLSGVHRKSQCREAGRGSQPWRPTAQWPPGTRTGDRLTDGLVQVGYWWRTKEGWHWFVVVTTSPVHSFHYWFVMQHMIAGIRYLLAT